MLLGCVCQKMPLSNIIQVLTEIQKRRLFIPFLIGDKTFMKSTFNYNDHLFVVASAMYLILYLIQHVLICRSEQI